MSIFFFKWPILTTVSLLELLNDLKNLLKICVKIIIELFLLKNFDLCDSIQHRFDVKHLQIV